MSGGWWNLPAVHVCTSCGNWWPHISDARARTHTHAHSLTRGKAWPRSQLDQPQDRKKIFERKGEKKTFKKNFDFLHCLISEINCRSESVCFSPNVCSQVAPSAAWSSFLFYHYHHYSATYTSLCPRVQWGTGVRRKYTMLREGPMWCWLPCQQSGCWVYVATKRVEREKDRGSE